MTGNSQRYFFLHARKPRPSIFKTGPWSVTYLICSFGAQETRLRVVRYYIEDFVPRRIRQAESPAARTWMATKITQACGRTPTCCSLTLCYRSSDRGFVMRTLGSRTLTAVANSQGERTNEGQRLQAKLESQLL